MSTHFLLKEIHTVKVLGASVAILIDNDGQPQVPIHPIIDAIGLGYDAEYNRLKADRRFGANRIEIRTKQGEVIL